MNDDASNLFHILIFEYTLVFYFNLILCFCDAGISIISIFSNGITSYMHALFIVVLTYS
jgi:hypothetical protein